MEIKFEKYEATGNDFVIIDDRDNDFDTSNHNLVALLCNRKNGVGADGLILLRNHSEYDFEMIYFNSDGNLSSMCGNGGRCIVGFANYLGIIEDKCTFLAADGVHHANLLENKVKLSMNSVREIQVLNDNVFVLDTGSPHYVTTVDDIEKINVKKEGSVIRNSKHFIKGGVNVNFLQIGDSPSIRSYERGVEDETLSCGTGTVACAIVLHKLTNNDPEENRVFSFDITTRGGVLEVEFEVHNNIFSNIYLKGGFNSVFSGRFIC